MSSLRDSQENADPPAALGGKLEAPGLDAREAPHSGNRRAHTAASQAFGQ
jgi:hypothetical protein